MYRDHFLYRLDEGGDPYHRFAYNYLAIAQIILSKHFYEFKEDDYMLDIGCGQGMSFWTAMNILPKMNYEAIELSKQAHRFLRQLNIKVYGNNILNLADKLEKNRYNFIVMSHSLEHFNSRDLNKLLNIIYQILKPDGIIIIEVPFWEVPQQHNSLVKSFLPDPTHLSFFSPRSLEILFMKHAFNIKFINTTGEKYEACQCQIINNKAQLNKSAISALRRAKLKRHIMKFLPRQLKNILHTYKALLRKKDLFSVLSADEFYYGGDRTAIRLLAKK